VNHITSGFRLRRYPWYGATRGIKDTANVDAADGILVVQIRRLGTISREIFQPAACAALITICDQRVRQCGMRSASRWPQAIFAHRILRLVPFRFDGVETGLWIPDVAGFLDANRRYPISFLQ
jgi:hypothetical protein